MTITSSKKFLGLSLLAAIVMTVPAHAESAATFGTGVVQCFHPDAQFVSVSFSRERAEANGRHTWKGWIKYREDGRADAMMSFTLDSRARDGETLARITPTTDSGASTPSTSCYLREWQRAYW